MPFRVEQSFQDILDHIQKIENVMRGVSLEEFQSDAVRHAAVERWLQNITEAGFRLGDQAAILCSDVDWANMRGLGNRLRHAYDMIDAERIYYVVSKQLAPLRENVTHALKKLIGGADDLA